MPFLPTFHILSLPNDFLSYYPNQLVNIVINTVFAFSIHFIPDTTMHSIGDLCREWLLQCWTHCNDVLVWFEQCLRPFIPFQPLFRLCWFDTCWYLKDTPPYLLASHSSNHVWLSTELLAWIAVALAVIHLGILIAKLALRVARSVSYVLHRVCQSWTSWGTGAFISRICASGVDYVVTIAHNLRVRVHRAATRFAASVSSCKTWILDVLIVAVVVFVWATTSGEKQRAAMQSADVQTEESLSEAEATSSSALQSEEQQVATMRPVIFWTEDKVFWLVAWLIGFLMGWLVYSYA